MILTTFPHHSDKLILTKKDLKVLQEGKELSVPGLTVNVDEKSPSVKESGLFTGCIADKENGILTVNDMIKRFLKDNGYDGLFYDGECGCELNDLVPCGADPSQCEPGYKVMNNMNDEYDFNIVPKKPTKETHTIMPE